MRFVETVRRSGRPEEPLPARRKAREILPTKADRQRTGYPGQHLLSSDAILRQLRFRGEVCQDVDLKIEGVSLEVVDAGEI